MKPKIFIGSSVESLSVAYSIQQNLTHDADVTVWDQGVFELSKTTIESLLDALSKSDFGIFVFNQDDVAKIRNENKNVIRDNVLFEFGLFIGKLGRERVFFVIPSNTDLHLPTDLLGITPGKYDAKREDKSLQAATGPVCHQIRLQIKKLGILNYIEETSSETVKKDFLSEFENSWVTSFTDKKYEDAIDILENKIKGETELEKNIELKIWSAYCQFKINELNGLNYIENLLDEHNTLSITYRGISRIYLWEDYVDKAIELLQIAIPKFTTDITLIKILAECYKKSEGSEKSISFLLENFNDKNIEIALELVSYYNEQKDYDDAREIIHKTYVNFPNNEKIKYIYAQIALELNLNEIALFFLNSLIIDFPTNSSYWGYHSNCCIALDLYDLAMISSRKANELTNEKEEWIISNIGNMLKNKGFYTDSIKYLEKGIELNKKSDFAHDRLSTSLKLKEEELEKSKSIANNGRKMLREYNKNI